MSKSIIERNIVVIHYTRKGFELKAGISVSTNYYPAHFYDFILYGYGYGYG